MDDLDILEQMMNEQHAALVTYIDALFAAQKKAKATIAEKLAIDSEKLGLSD